MTVIPSLAQSSARFETILSEIVKLLAREQARQTYRQEQALEVKETGNG